MSGKSFANRRELFAIAAPTDKPFIEVWHVSTPGFGARIMRVSKRTGQVRRVYLARYSDTEGRDTKTVIGEFEAVTFDDAHRQALDLRTSANNTRRTGQRPLPTLGEALEQYLIERQNQLSDSTIENYRKKWGYLRDHHERNVLELPNDWWLERYLVLAKHGRPTADAVMRIAHAVYQSLVNDERLTSNPVKRVAAKYRVFTRDDPRQRLVRRQDLPKMWQWLETRANPVVRDMVRMMLFTGVRDAVAGALRWETIDVDHKLLLLPAEERGNKAKRLVWVPIADWLHEHIIVPRHRARLADVPWLLPSPKKAGAPLRDIRGSLAVLHTETGVYANPHTLRRTFATVAQAATGSELLVARMLTHSIKTRGSSDAPAVTAGYIVSDTEQIRQAFNDTAALMLEYAGVK